MSGVFEYYRLGSNFFVLKPFDHSAEIVKMKFSVGYI